MTTQSAKRPRPRRQRATSGLTEQRILDAAIVILESDGADALTFRRLGTELGVDHTTVVRQFRNKDGLILALSARLTETALYGLEPSNDWRELLTSMARRVRAACREHPALAILAATRTAPRPSEFRGADLVIGALFEAGLRGEEAASIYRAVVQTALALSAFEASIGRLDEETQSRDRLAWRREYLMASATDYPHLASVAPYLAQIDETDQFETVIQLFLDAIDARAEKARSRAANGVKTDNALHQQ